MTNPSHLKVRYLQELPLLPPGLEESAWGYAYVPNGPDRDYKYPLAAYGDNTYIDVRKFGAVGDGVTDDTEAIQRAIDFAEEIGGATIVFPPGEYMVYKDNPTGSTGTMPDDMALHIKGSGVRLVGYGAKIKALPSDNGFVLIRIGTLPLNNGVVSLYDISIEGLELDGSWEPEVIDGSNHTYSAIISYGVKRLTLRDLYIHNVRQYGIGLQNGGHVDTLIENVLIEDVMADGIDIKNNGSTDSGTRISNVIVRRFGWGDLPATAYAGIDLMGPCALSNIVVEDWGHAGTALAGIRFKQGVISDGRGIGAHNSTLTNFRIQANTGGLTTATYGVQAAAHGVSISNGVVTGAGRSGVFVQQELCAVDNVLCRDGASAGFLAGGSTYETNGDYTTYTECRAIDNAGIGFEIAANYCSMANCVSRGNATNFRPASGADYTTWSGGALVSPVTTNVNNASASKTTVVQGATGYPTSARVESSPFDVDSIGVKTITISHGLPFAPPASACQISLKRGENYTAWEVSRAIVVSTNSTQVLVYITVSTASPTPGDTATVLLAIDSEKLP